MPRFPSATHPAVYAYATRRRAGTNMIPSVTLWLWKLCACLLKKQKPNYPLFTNTYPKLLSVLKSCQQRMGVPQNRVVTPHCFRQGGGSFWFTKSMPIPDIITHGRWASDKSAKVIQAGAALVFGSHLTAKLQHLSLRLAVRPITILIAFPFTN